jgi:Plasmid replication region DNA-binding N-term
MTALPSGPGTHGVSQSDVSHAADSLLRTGERPTAEKVRAKIGRGSFGTLGPLLDAWWKTLSSRLDSGPAAFHRLPETVAHVAEALWMQALEETRRRLLIEQRDTARIAELDKQRLEVRSHVLTLREGELDSRLRDRDRTIEELNLRLRELAGILRKEQATRDVLSRQIVELQSASKPIKRRRQKKHKVWRPKPRSVKLGASKRAAKKRQTKSR